ncbi:hypothetical protein [Streptomyces rugosispiralis]|uniref:Uncharacterized protein n=1 Tax=Streptomyces rugosispiralis TaxID=2967341 RepID=A0ABT1V727_9ACTN|nr:hypothetical protein [Streptomyces rugosispiralis]MCQ8193190.1 hypothetical protein [Streptomyces rugosispiralis]
MVELEGESAEGLLVRRVAAAEAGELLLACAVGIDAYRILRVKKLLE